MKITFVSFLFLLAFHISFPVFAQPLGYLRVQVVQTPPAPEDHTWPMQLQTNGKKIGSSFAHASQGFEWTALSIQNLSAKASVTTISAVYGEISSHGCEFDFEIFFSFVASGTGISLGRFHAPTSASTGSLPIGLHCKGISGEVCSDDPVFRKQIIDLQNKARINAYNAWKQDYDEHLRRQQEGLAQEQFLLESIIESATIPETHAAPTPMEIAAFNSLENLEAQNEFDRNEEIKNLSLIALDETTSPVLLAENATPIIDQAFRNQLHMEIEEKHDALVKTGLGGFVVLYDQLTRGMDDAIADQRAWAQMLIDDETVSAEEAYAANVAAAQMNWYLFMMGTSGALAEGAKAGIRLAAGDPIEACEALGGRKDCISEQRLTFDERLISTVSVFLGNRQLFSKIQESIEEKILDKTLDVVDTLEDLHVELEPGRHLSELIINELVDGQGKVVADVLNKMHSGNLASKALQLSMVNGNRVLISRNSDDLKSWTFEVQVPGKFLKNFVPRYTLVLTLNEEGVIESVK